MLIDPGAEESPTGRYQWKPVLIGLLFINLVGVLALIFVPSGASSQATHAKPKAASMQIDHSIMNNPDLLAEPNPAPMAIAAYD